MRGRDAGGILETAAGQVLETMFFASATPLEEPPLQAPGVVATVCFRGTDNGALTVALEEGAARTIAGNFLGEEDAAQIQPARVGEVVCELANMLCGAVLSRWNVHGQYDLQTPELGLVHNPPFTAACVFDTGAGNMSVTLTVSP